MGAGQITDDLNRSTVKGESKYFIREIKNVFVIGQTYPVQEVPGPHARKITDTIKRRLQIIAFKLLKKSAEERLKITRLMKYFPDQNELQMRQRLKVKIYIQRSRMSSLFVYRNSWNTIAEALIKDFGDLKPTGLSQRNKTC